MSTQFIWVRERERERDNSGLDSYSGVIGRQRNQGHIPSPTSGPTENSLLVGGLFAVGFDSASRQLLVFDVASHMDAPIKQRPVSDSLDIFL